MPPRRALLGVDDPVALDLLRERIERAEPVVGDDRLPHGPLARLPARDDLGALDDDVLALGRLVGDPPPVADAATARLDPLAVLAGVHGHRVARLRDGGRVADRPQRVLRRPIGAVRPVGRDVQHGHDDSPFPSVSFSTLASIDILHSGHSVVSLCPRPSATPSSVGHRALEVRQRGEGVRGRPVLQTDMTGVAGLVEPAQHRGPVDGARAGLVAPGVVGHVDMADQVALARRSERRDPRPSPPSGTRRTGASRAASRSPRAAGGRGRCR